MSVYRRLVLLNGIWQLVESSAPQGSALTPDDYLLSAWQQLTPGANVRALHFLQPNCIGFPRGASFDVGRLATQLALERASAAELAAAEEFSLLHYHPAKPQQRIKASKQQLTDDILKELKL